MPSRTSITDEAVSAIRSLYESGAYVAAWQRTQSLPPFREWAGAAALTIAGRLLNNLEAPRLAHALHARAWREHRGDPDAAYYRASTIARRFGPLRALRFLDSLPRLRARGCAAEGGAGTRRHERVAVGRARVVHGACGPLRRRARIRPARIRSVTMVPACGAARRASSHAARPR